MLAPTSALLNLARAGLGVPHSPVIERDGDGMVSLVSSTPGAEMKYSVNKGPEKTYRKPFKLPEGEVRAWAAAGKSGKVPPTSPGERNPPRQGAGRMEDSECFLGRTGYRACPLRH